MNKLTLTAMADVASPALGKHIKEPIIMAVPFILANFFSSGVLGSSQEPSSKNGNSEKAILVPQATKQTRRPLALPIVMNTSSQHKKIWSSLQSSEAFFKPPAKKIESRPWSHLCVLPPWKLV